MNEEQIEEFLEKYNKVCQNKNELTMVANNFDSKDEVNKEFWSEIFKFLED